MGKYIARRLLWLPVILLIISFITFMLGRFGPGDPVEILLGQHSNPKVVERIREQRGLNDNVMIQYGRYLRNVTRGDFGESFKYRGRSVAELLKKKMWVSAQLNIAALIISIGLGIPIGLFAALKQGTAWDISAVVFTLLGQSIPVFLTAPTLLLVFALKLDILPTHGWGGFFDTRIILPAVAMGIPGVAIITRMTRASTLDVITQDYIRTARAKGLTEGAVRRTHILRNSMIPVVTMLGFSLAGLAFTSFIVERFFGIPGVGNLFIEAIFARDYPIINAVIIIGTTMFVGANLVVDLLYPMLDPRIRLGGASVAD
ncbi:MAG: ABC transporter permease [Chloroflexi bacterium]|nr:ABC transporter permease [Chloroflexota bacterium]MCI0780744.1 ABC transporter permease [Chloroflexota bacterium]MCI0785938.1 ABC transporter permease [Chloroflexota bacterium]MCI0798354.1 ABC transporter permease [Chloroflexota bacterium]MCI0894813.1 ABC transporter permease [Chloroflexota bacterium]